ncbi:YbaN family protein [Rhizobium grahamii]|uniref:YbaN family protein n=1 Tax=Rhizobium grahamii TaxID=1120045 RepID=UPI001AED0CED
MSILGLIGLFCPLTPTTIFLILAAWFFGRSSPHFETYLLEHPRLGPPFRNWRESRAISPKGKRWPE